VSNVVDIFNQCPTPLPTTAAPPLTTVPVPTGSPPVPPQTSAIPHPPPPSAGVLCTSDCGACCCPGCHAVNGTCYLCDAGSFSSDCSDHLQSSCRTCPSGFFCPQGAAQPYLPSSILAVNPKGAHAVASAPPLDFSEKKIVRPSAAAADVEAVVLLNHRQLPSVVASPAPNDDDISADMTDQCSPFSLHLPPLLPQPHPVTSPLLPSVSLTRLSCGPKLSSLYFLRCTSAVCVTQWVARYFTMEVMSDPVVACDGFT
jgi:hypothetical protein